MGCAVVGGALWLFISTDERRRIQQLSVLRDWIACYPEPCLVMGDFDNLLLESKKDGGNGRMAASMQSFRDFVAQARLLDLGFEGYPYVWRNKRDDGFIQEKA